MYSHRHDNTTNNNDKVLFKLGNMKNSTQDAQLDWKKKIHAKILISDKQPQLCRRLSKPTLPSYTVVYSISLPPFGPEQFRGHPSREPLKGFQGG